VVATADPPARPFGEGEPEATPAEPARDSAGRPWTAVGPADAPAIVFIHGTRLTRAQWLPQLRRLSARYRCVAVDLPGHGALGGEPFRVDAAVELIRATIDAEVPSGRAVLVGLSLGGYMAIDTAERYPERVAGLVLAGCSAEAIGPSAAPYRFFRWLLRRAPERAQDVANRAFFRARYRRPVSEPIIEGGFWPEGGAAALDHLLGRRYLDRLGRLWTPVLVVNGAFDPVFGPQGEYWAASCRQGRNAVVPLAMHLSNLDRPTTFSRLVAAFATRVSRGG
jgi:pimeloyl-ACP methyl ester carboxylesterase